MELFLTLLSGICWSIVYIEIIRHGFKDKTYGMPLFALGLNFAWEVIYSIDSLSNISVQGIVNIIWVALDVVIVFTYFKYGKEFFPDKAKAYFIPFSILVFMTCFVIQFAFYLRFDSIEASEYSAFLQNAAMSVLFVTMLFMRGNTRGQSISIAIAKWIGTLAPTILMGFLESFNIYIILCGIICSVFDIIYIIFISLHADLNIMEP